MLVVCVNDPLCAVICAVYNTGVVVVVTVLELDPPPPPQPTIIPTNKTAHIPIAARVRSSPPALAKHTRASRITKQQNATATPGPNPRFVPGKTKIDQRESFCCRNAALTTPKVTVVLPDAVTVTGEIVHVISAGTTQVSVTVPENEFTGAMLSLLLMVVVPLRVTAVGLAASWKSAGAAAVPEPSQSEARLNASTDPSPVTWSYPAPAEYPSDPFVQFFDPVVHGTILFPLVTS